MRPASRILGCAALPQRHYAQHSHAAAYAVARKP
jgi:hypothetical protein